jgi:hypothetical protein
MIVWSLRDDGTASDTHQCGVTPAVGVPIAIRGGER